MHAPLGAELELRSSLAGFNNILDLALEPSNVFLLSKHRFELESGLAIFTLSTITLAVSRHLEMQLDNDKELEFDNRWRWVLLLNSLNSSERSLSWLNAFGFMIQLVDLCQDSIRLTREVSKICEPLIDCCHH